MHHNPYDAIKHSVHLPLCGLLATGACYKIMFAWYEADCPDLHPNTNYQQIAGLSNRSWEENEDRIMAVLNECMPQMREICKKNRIAAENRRKALDRAREATRRARAKQPSFADKETESVEIRPINFSEKKWNEGRSDQIEVERVKQAKKLSIDANDPASFTD